MRTRVLRLISQYLSDFMMLITWEHQPCSFNYTLKIFWECRVPNYFNQEKKLFWCWWWWNIHWNFRYSLICLDTCFRRAFKRTCLSASVCLCPCALGNILRSMSFSFEQFFFLEIWYPASEQKKKKKQKEQKTWGHWTYFKNIFRNLCYRLIC